MPAIVLLLALLVPATAARAWTWLPPDRRTPSPLADPREPSLGFDAVEGGDWSARVGHSVAIGRARPVGGLEVGLDGHAWLWFSSLPRLNFPLETVDGSFGFWTGSAGDRWSWRARLAHWSGHLGDGASMLEERRIVYSRESLTGLVFWQANPHLLVHGGPALFVRADPPTQAFQFQLGGELAPDRATAGDRGPQADPYLAVDFRAKAENRMRMNQSYRAGVRLGGVAAGNAFRIALGYDTGLSERGQAYRMADRYVSLGCTFGR